MLDYKTSFEEIDTHFFNCLKFWEKKLNIDSDLDNTAYLKALEDILMPVRNEYVPCSPLRAVYSTKNTLNLRAYNDELRYRCMDIYGRNWEKEYQKIELSEELYQKWYKELEKEEKR